MSETFVKQNKSFSRALLESIVSFGNLKLRLFAVLGLLFITAALSGGAFAQATTSQYSQGFEVDGMWSPTSTVTRVPSGTNGVTSKSGSFHGQVGTNSTRWGGYNATFPARGYITTVAIYLNVGGGYGNNTRFDWDSAISDTSANFRRDFIFNAGYFNDSDFTGSGPRFVVSASNNSQPGSAFAKNPGNDPFTITSTGWYTFKHKFYANGSNVLAVEMSILDSSGNVLHTWTRSDASDVIGTTVGGNRYGWFDFNEFPFLAIDDSDRSNFTQQSSISVTPAVVPTATDNDYTRINEAVQYIANNGTITLNGTFNWTEANAAASWAKGSDGVAGGAFANDDYSILVPANLNGVTFTAPSLGAAEIQGPGDLAAINLEGVFYFNGGDNQNWTISNMRFLDFDISIGMFNGAGGSDAFNGTIIQNNYIWIPNDLNATVAPADVNQNIGIHFSFGTNQLITGNTIDTPGDGVSAAPNFSSVVGMQSNTSGGAVYNGLQITNNIINILNAQNNANPQTVLGIWENSHGHTGNVTVSGNQFLSLAGGNNPAVNLLRGFRVTSHSSPTTTVAYSNNRVEGANIGFQWIAGSNFAGNQPVRLTSNIIRNGATGVLVQSNGLANLTFNRIVGNSASGVENIAGSTTTAENNWWGCNYGPGAGGAGCSGTANGTIGTVDANPWLTLRTSATPNAISTGGNSSISSNLNFNSDNIDTSGSGNVPNGTPANFAGTLGTVSPPTGTTTSGVTGTTFTAGASPGAGNAATTIDGQTVSAPIAIAFSCNNVSIPTGTTVLRNNQFVVPVNVDDTTGRGILAYDFAVTYNPAVVSLVAVETVGTMSAGWTITTNSTSGNVIISGFNISPLTGSGVLLNLRFTATGAIGTSSGLNFSGFMFNEGVPCVNTSNGDVTVISGTVSGTITYANAISTTPVPFTTVNAAGSIPLSTSTDLSGNYSLSGFGTGAYTVTPSKANQVNGISNFDASTVAQHVVVLIVLNATQQIAADVSGNGSITSLDAAYIAQFVALISNPGVTGTWRFIPPNRGYANVEANYSGEDYSAILMGEVTGNWNPAGPLRPSNPAGLEPVIKTENRESLQPIVTVTAPPLQFAATGSNFTVLLTASDTTQIAANDGIIGYQFDLFYNNSVITPQAVPCDLSGTISSNLSVICNPIAPGHIIVVVFGTTPLTGAGTLMKLKFFAAGAPATTSPLTIQNFMFNEGIPQDVTVNGSVLIVGPTAASVSIGGRLTTATGQPVSKANVYLTDTRGQIRSAISNPFGRFTFDDVTAGETYIISVVSKRYTFAPTAISPTDSTKDLNIIAEQ